MEYLVSKKVQGMSLSSEVGRTQQLMLRLCHLPLGSGLWTGDPGERPGSLPKMDGVRDANKSKNLIKVTIHCLANHSRNVYLYKINMFGNCQPWGLADKRGKGLGKPHQGLSIFV